jgi:iron-sulfur cluster assembly accessory protein
MITVTDNAKKQALRLMEDEGKDGLFIRVGVQGGGCSGLMYQLTFDNQELEDQSRCRQKKLFVFDWHNIGFFRRIKWKRFCFSKPQC